jgi:hypothetical protein
MNMDKLTSGIVVLKMDTFLSKENPRTKGWKCENNDCETGSRQLVGSSNNNSTVPEEEVTSRKLGGVKLCDAFKFEFAIDGKVTSWNKATFTSKDIELQRTVHVWTILDDESYSNKENVEVAIRMLGCGISNTFLLTHVYWI